MRRVGLTGVLLASVAATTVNPKVAHSAERTGWEDIPAGEMALTCIAELAERRTVLNGGTAVFRIPLVSEAIRVPPLLRKRPEIDRNSTDAEREAAARWNEAWAAYIKPRQERFTEFLLKSRPHEAGKARVECNIATFATASRWGIGRHDLYPPMVIGAEFRDPYKPEDMSSPVWGRTYREDFLPPDWTKGLPDAVVAKAAAAPKPPAPTAPKSATSAGGSLNIEQDTSAADVRRAWDQQVAQTLAKEAQRRAATLAKQAQNDARLQAEAEKARHERVKRGRAQ